MSEITLSGDWVGTYGYEGAPMPAVPVEVSFIDNGGVISGSSREPNTFRPGEGPELFAEFHGTRAEDTVLLTKVYIGFSQGDDPVYDGKISADFQRIDGNWRFPRHGWRGPFRLRRVPPLAARAERRVEVEACG